MTFTIAYPAAVALGKVLLQTAPERGFPVGQTEAFLKVMRDVSSPPINQICIPFLTLTLTILILI